MRTLAYPIGSFEEKSSFSLEDCQKAIVTLEAFPELLESVCDSLQAEDWSKNYRPGSWTICQLIHHLADSHMNGYIRTRFAYAQEGTTIKPYDENAWAACFDYEDTDIQDALLILKGVHKRWVRLLKGISQEDWTKNVWHPESKKSMSIAFLANLYAWHSLHHLEHIKQAKVGL